MNDNKPDPQYREIDEAEIIFDGRHVGSRALRIGAQIRIYHSGLVHVWSPRQLKWNEVIGIDAILAAELAHALKGPWVKLDMNDPDTLPEVGEANYGPYYMVVDEYTGDRASQWLWWFDGRNFWTTDNAEIDQAPMIKGKHVLMWCAVPKVPVE